MAIKINDYSYTPKGHFEDVTISGSYHNIISVSWTKESNRRYSNIITTAVYKNEDSYKAGNKPFQQIGYGIQLTELSSSISSSIIYEYSGSTPIESSSINHTINTRIDISSGKQWLDNITSNSPSANMLSSSYEVLKSQVPLYSGSRHIVDVL